MLYFMVEKNASQHTVISYLAVIDSFARFAKLQGVGEVLFANVRIVIIRSHYNENSVFV
jgi:integrase/recombinase XerC